MHHQTFGERKTRFFFSSNFILNVVQVFTLFHIKFDVQCIRKICIRIKFVWGKGGGMEEEEGQILRQRQPEHVIPASAVGCRLSIAVSVQEPTHGQIENLRFK